MQRENAVQQMVVGRKSVVEGVARNARHNAIAKHGAEKGVLTSGTGWIEERERSIRDRQIDAEVGAGDKLAVVDLCDRNGLCGEQYRNIRIGDAAVLLDAIDGRPVNNVIAYCLNKAAEIQLCH